MVDGVSSLVALICPAQLRVLLRRADTSSTHSPTMAQVLLRLLALCCGVVSLVAAESRAPTDYAVLLRQFALRDMSAVSFAAQQPARCPTPATNSSRRRSSSAALYRA